MAKILVFILAYSFECCFLSLILKSFVGNINYVSSTWVAVTQILFYSVSAIAPTFFCRLSIFTLCSLGYKSAPLFHVFVTLSKLFCGIWSLHFTSSFPQLIGIFFNARGKLRM